MIEPSMSRDTIIDGPAPDSPEKRSSIKINFKPADGRQVNEKDVDAQSVKTNDIRREISAKQEFKSKKEEADAKIAIQKQISQSKALAALLPLEKFKGNNNPI